MVICHLSLFLANQNVTTFQPGDPEGNFNRAAEFIRSGASQGAQLAVLPEYHLTGYAPQDPSFKRAGSQWEEYLKKYQDLAKECKINIVPGTLLVQVDDKAEKLANVAYFINENGEILGQYQKKNLWYARLRVSIHDVLILRPYLKLFNKGILNAHI